MPKYLEGSRTVILSHPDFKPCALLKTDTRHPRSFQPEKKNKSDRDFRLCWQGVG